MMKKRGLVILLIVSLAIFGCQKQEIEEIIEEDLGSGILVIDSIPAEADVFMDDVSSGKTPLELSNVKAGQHSIIIKKEGYEDFQANSFVEAGKRSFIEASLVLMPKIEEKEIPEDIKTMEKEEIIEREENKAEQVFYSESKIMPGNNIIFYYDFSEKQFTNVRNPNADAFSRKYPKYFVFTRYSPAIVKAIDKDIDLVAKEDCLGISGQYEYLNPGKSLCIVTKENEIIAIGGSWDSTENAELAWKLFS